VARPGIQLGNDCHSTVDRVLLPSDLRVSTHKLGSNPDSAAPTPPQVKRPRAQVQSRLGGPDVTSRATNELNSPSTLEASGRLLQHNSATGFSELPDKISTAWIEQILSPVNGTCLRSMELVSGQRTYLQLTDQAVTTNRASGYHIELLQLRPTV